MIVSLKPILIGRVDKGNLGFLYFYILILLQKTYK